jgi:hypothetical protein
VSRELCPVQHAGTDKRPCVDVAPIGSQEAIEDAEQVRFPPPLGEHIDDLNRLMTHERQTLSVERDDPFLIGQCIPHAQFER